ncbi:hypothetical protein [Aeromicrobium choanae]|uniref:META domain-containing protein n=1 Tax=Aeromicrobium choanae TaxID=1736691 RepID=A0A1T4Z3A3_9ACTN|nr:hypothetical protein [Aeromicrobium choanae]SKB08529.1 hypothetical protein SAMN06295964_2195 [Aeromicrobium choanae]
MRLLAALLLALTLLTGCADDGDPLATTETSEVEAPEDTLPVLGLWESEPLDSGRTIMLTLSDDNSYVAENECLELVGRWELAGGQVVLTPDERGSQQCGDDAGAPVELPPALTVDGDTLVPEGVGPTFTRN